MISTWQVSRLPKTIEISAQADCSHCSLPLSLSQPDVDLPGRLLGICERCKRWYLVELDGFDP
jgi:hypothetical protein